MLPVLILVFCVEKLLSANRPRTAFEALGDKVFKVSGALLIIILNGIGTGHESDAPLQSSWHISRMFKAISSDVLVPRSELAGLEFAYYEILRDGDYGTPTLFEDILNSPESFMELICMAYKPRHSKLEPIPENMQGAVQIASSLLHHGGGTPGRDSNGNIDSDKFFRWIKKVRELANEHDRSEITDLTIGAWLSDWPFNKSLKVWPEFAIANLLDQDDCENIRRGFSTGVHNSRGISSRSPYDGGNQERTIANKFNSFAASWANENPNVAAMIEDIAKSFEYDARRHDDDALWTQET